MKKRLYILLMGMSLIFTACANNEKAGNGSELNSADADQTESGTEESNPVDAADIADAANAAYTANSADTANAADTDAESNKESLEENQNEINKNEADKNESDNLEETEFIYITVENPSEDYYCKDGLNSKDGGLAAANPAIKLTMLTKEENEIIDTEKWFADNGLENVETNVIEDAKYRYVLDGDDGYSNYIIYIYDKESGEYLKTLDFSKYRYASEYKAEDYNYIEQRIWWVQSVDDVLYVSIGHNTYTESSPHTGYIVALDLADADILWKSAPCTSNSRNFAIIDDTIVCGYGFTSEPDNLNLVNISDGTLREQIPLKTMAEYIICKDDVLYVRTYNMNYTFQVGK